VRWLNNGDKPAGFKDIKGIPKKKQIRKLRPDDMLGWEDGLKLISATNNIQLKAIIATQLDGGFRPSEFVDLNYGDATIKGEFNIVRVNDGKTGSRNAILWRAVPYLMRWLQNHPTKKRSDPLWLQETKNHEKVIRYGYFAIQKRISQLAKKINFDKPLDFYNLRHSACTISKMDNVPEELAAAKFGHSVNYYVNTYGRLSTEDILQRYSNHYGITVKSKEPQKNIICSRCEFVNEPNAEVCEKCGAALNIKKALEIQDENKNLKEEMSNLKDQFNKINLFMNRFVENNPDILDVLANKAAKNKEKIL
jgi:integrase/ribosomal protein L40E